MRKRGQQGEDVEGAEVRNVSALDMYAALQADGGSVVMPDPLRRGLTGGGAAGDGPAPRTEVAELSPFEVVRDFEMRNSARSGEPPKVLLQVRPTQAVVLMKPHFYPHVSDEAKMARFSAST